MPSQSTVPPIRQYGTSAPSLNAISLSSSFESPVLKRVFIPLRTAAASLLPPARPAATGICLFKEICTPLVNPVFSRKTEAAR